MISHTAAACTSRFACVSSGQVCRDRPSHSRLYHVHFHEVRVSHFLLQLAWRPVECLVQTPSVGALAGILSVRAHLAAGCKQMKALTPKLLAAADTAGKPRIHLENKLVQGLKYKHHMSHRFQAVNVDVTELRIVPRASRKIHDLAVD